MASTPVRPRVGVKTRAAFWAGSLGVVALAAATLVGPGALASFNTSRSVSGTYSSGVLNAPSPLSCFWVWYGDDIVILDWVNTSPSFAQGYNVLRSNTSGSGYATVGSPTPATNTSYAEVPPSPHTTPRYYAVQSYKSTWTSPNSNEKATNSCRGAINAWAGNGTAGFAGDSGPATAAQLNQPFSVRFDAAGNGYIADWVNNRIRKVDLAGNISTVVGGSGAASPCTYTGAVAGLRLNAPRDLAFDVAGNLFILDGGVSLGAQGCVHKVDTSGNVTQFAGGGATTTCLTFGYATDLKLVNPSGLAIDSAGWVYISDTLNNCVRKVTPTGGVFVHVAGTGTAGGTACNTSGATNAVNLFWPHGLAIDAADTVYITDALANCVRKVVGSTYSHVAGGGATATCGNATATTVSLSAPTGVAVDGSGRVFIADRNNRCLRKVVGSAVSQVAFTGTSGSTGNNGPAYAATALQPGGITLGPGENLYVTDIDSAAGGSTVRKIIGPVL